MFRPRGIRKSRSQGFYGLSLRLQSPKTRNFSCKNDLDFEGRILETRELEFQILHCSNLV